MKRAFDVDSITDIDECNVLLKKLTRHKSILLMSVHNNELRRLKEINPSFSKELETSKPSMLSGSLAVFTIDGINYHVDQFKPKESLRMTVFVSNLGLTFIVRKIGAVSSDCKFDWEKMDRVIEFAKFLISNAEFLNKK